MLQPGDSVEFSFWEAGCMIWLGSLDIYESFCQAWFSLEDNVIKTDGVAIQDLILNQRAIMPMELYQDDGFRTRVILRELDEREQADWTARAAWQLNLPTGQMVMSGIVDCNQEVPAFSEVAPEDMLQLYVDVPPGEYAVTVYAYPPGDLSTGWGQIVDPDLFEPTVGIEPENPLDYFLRTRPGEAMPDWLGSEYGATEAEREQHHQAGEKSPGFIDFVVQLLPLKEPLPRPQLDGEMFIPWEFRKPQRFPLGVPAQA
ncbi:hypothetical protein [Synechococcus sp. PCC 6312]|uniref:hypothetical protein n=1 Tax=Synechococcus sp. (strain ATCC 27167 / PCC 6312) TaxID=195253 RepID=UPI00029EF08A|nr:hypothetical protein [Synechococcus sp. PCC 6312]AFY62014.1 hypothetical protein Syn6312_2955 [Synechococcus sp. PCC 6312]